MSIEQARDALALECDEYDWCIGLIVEDPVIVVLTTDFKAAKAAMPGSRDGFLIQVRLAKEESHPRDFEIPSENE